MIGGAVFCGMYYWYMFLFDQPDVAIDGVVFGTSTHGKEPVHDDIPLHSFNRDIEHKAGLDSCGATLHGDLHDDHHHFKHSPSHTPMPR